MIDVVKQIEAVQREVGPGTLAAGDARSVRLRRTYDAPIDGRRDRSAGSMRSSEDREKRLWPPGVVNTRSLPASLQRRMVAGDTPRTRLASERLIQSGFARERGTDPTHTYPNRS